jgi:hypothetical protein
VTANTPIKNVDLDAIARAAGHVENALDIAPKISFEERDTPPLRGLTMRCGRSSIPVDTA